MKSLVRWSATAGLVATTFVSSLAIGGLRVLALTPEQIVQKLRPIPVFTIADNKGAPLVATPPQGQQGKPVAGLFISRQDAQAFLENLKNRNSALAKDVRVVPVSLAEVYQMEQSGKGKPNELDFAYVPSKQQVDTALTLLRQGGQQVNQFNGTPLFVARAGQDKGYLTVQQGNQAVIPMFFNKEELQVLVDRFKQQQPNLAKTVDIQVLNLEGLMEALQKQNDPQLDKIVLIPPRDSIQYVQSLVQQQRQPGGAPQVAPAGGTPAPRPANNAPAPAPAPKR